MAKASVKPAVSQPTNVPSTVEHAAVQVVRAVTVGDCAVVRGVLAGWELRAHFAQERDARVQQLVAYYQKS
jgi:hypothetical protein